MIKKMFGLIISLLLFCWIAIIAYDYYLVTNDKEPKFCIDTGEEIYPDGTVKWCMGLGYKAYNYNRDTFKAIQFGPAWIKEQKLER